MKNKSNEFIFMIIVMNTLVMMHELHDGQNIN